MPLLPLHRGDPRSYGGGDRRTYFIHPTNETNQEREHWLAAIDRGGSTWVPAGQPDKMELVGDLDAGWRRRVDTQMSVLAQYEE